MQYIGVYGDGQRIKGEHPPNSALTAGKELIDAGVIFIGAAGNANQKQVSSNHPDFNNYWASSAGVALTNATHTEFFVTAYNTLNRRGYPQQLGKFISTETGQVVYPVINIGALDDAFASNGKERKVNYSDMGNEIDCYAAADGTLSATNTASGSARPDTYTISGGGVDGGVTLIANSNTEITGTSAFRLMVNKAMRITTNGSTGTATTISLNLQGGAGLSGISTVPLNGAPGIGVTSRDDGYWTLTLPFNIQFAGITTDTIYPGTNSYITFTAGSISYSGLSVSNPLVPKIMISSADNSGQRIYYGDSGVAPNRTYRVRFEGTNATSGILGSPNMVYEATFYENTPNQIDIHVGTNARVASGGVLTSYDAKFSGTSAACPVAAGLIATKLQHNRTWTWQDVRNWLQNTVGDADTNQFDTGVESTSATDANWANVNSLEGGRPIVIWDALTGNEPIQGTTTISGNITFNGINIR